MIISSFLNSALKNAGCYSRPSRPSFDADFYDDYDQPDSEDDARENELAHSTHQSKFVTKDNSETEALRGHSAELECAVDRFAHYLDVLFKCFISNIIFTKKRPGMSIAYCLDMLFKCLILITIFT